MFVNNPFVDVALVVILVFMAGIVEMLIVDNDE